MKQTQLYKWCAFWVKMKEDYALTLDPSIIRSIYTIEGKIESIVKQIQAEIEQRASQTEPLDVKLTKILQNEN